MRLQPEARLACCTGTNPKKASVLGFFESNRMHSTIQDEETKFRELPYNELPIFSKQQ